MFVAGEHRQHRIAAEAEQIAVLEQHDLDQLAEGPIHHPGDHLGATFAHLGHEALGEGGESRDVGEEHGAVDVPRPQLRMIGQPFDRHPGHVERMLRCRHPRKLLEKSVARSRMHG